MLATRDTSCDFIKVIDNDCTSAIRLRHTEIDPKLNRSPDKTANRHLFPQDGETYIPAVPSRHHHSYSKGRYIGGRVWRAGSRGEYN
jgi:hypothetical protein